MKKLFILILSCCIVLSGCGKDENLQENSENYLKEENLPQEDESYYDKNGDYVVDQGAAKLIAVNSGIPYNDLEFNGSLFGISSVVLCQKQTDNGYSPLVFVRFDLSNLTDEEFGKLIQNYDSHSDGVFALTAAFSSEKNQVVNENFWVYEYSLEKDNAYFLMYSEKEYQNDLSDIEVSISIDIDQDDIYSYKEDGETKEANIVYAYTIWINKGYGIELDIQDADVWFEESEYVTAKEAVENSIEGADKIDDFEKPEYDKFNSAASENGLDGTLVYIEGNVADQMVVEDSLVLTVEQEDGNKWGVCLFVDYKIEKLQGQRVRVFGEYIGYSNVLNMPTIVVRRGDMFGEKNGRLEMKEERVYVPVLGIYE